MLAHGRAPATLSPLTRLIVLLTLLPVLVVGGLLATARPAQAAGSQPDTRIRYTQTFDAYVAAGETVTAIFRATARPNSHAVTLTATRPDGVASSCTVAVGAAITTACSLTGLTSGASGVWTIAFDRPTAVNGSNPSTFSWSIDVASGGTVIPGRVWSDGYLMYNTGSTALSLWYVGPNGSVYRADYTGYTGIDSIFQANQFGVVTTGTCTPAYRSIDELGPYADPAYTPSAAGCGQPYHVFFEAPAPDLPTSAMLPDGSSVFVLPPVVTPTISNLAFVPASPGSRQGTFTFDVANFVGTARLQIDAEGNGSYTDPVDRVIPVAVAASGAASVAFDGLDANGAAIPPTTEIHARVLIDQANEIHFVNSDVEQRISLAVTALRGQTPGSRTLYWNDTYLRVADRICPTPVTDGTAGVDSAGGVHGWDCSAYTLAQMNRNDGINGSWGDVRDIDDWTFQPVNVTAALTIPVEVANYTVAKTSSPASGTALAPGQRVNYTIAVAQVGNVPAVASLTDDLSRVVDDATYDGDVSASVGTASVVGSTLAWSGTLPVGGTATITYSATVRSAAAIAAGGDYSLANAVTSAGCAASCPTSSPIGAYTFAKTVSPGTGSTVTQGSTVRYTLTVRQVGQGAVTGASLDDDLSGVLDHARWNGDASAGSGTLTRTGDLLHWSGDLPVGSIVRITYSVTATGGTGTRLLNSVATSSPAGECDPLGTCETELALADPPPSSLVATGVQWPVPLAVGALLLAGGAALRIPARRRAR